MMNEQMMKRGDVIRYADMTISEGFSIQRGMNSYVNNRDYCIILMSVRKNAPYADRFEDNGTTIIYEGHDVQTNFIVDEHNPKDIDQSMKTPSGRLTENGRFYQMAEQYRQGMPAKSSRYMKRLNPEFGSITVILF